MNTLRGIAARLPRSARWLAVLAWMGVIFGMSSLHGSSVPGRFSSLGHLILYTVLGGLLWLALDRGGDAGAVIALAIVIASFYGVSDEFHQSFVPGRTPDVVDWGVDTLGALLGATLAWWLLRGKDA